MRMALYASIRWGGLGMPAGHGSIEQRRSSAFSASIKHPQPTLIPMNHQGVSEIFFEESYTVSANQTAKSPFALLPHGNGYAERLIECLITGCLVAVVESICIREMQQHVDAAAEEVVGSSIRMPIEGQSRQARRCGCADGSNAWESGARRFAFKPTMRTRSSARPRSRWWLSSGHRWSLASPQRFWDSKALDPRHARPASGGARTRRNLRCSDAVRAAMNEAGEQSARRLRFTNSVPIRSFFHATNAHALAAPMRRDVPSFSLRGRHGWDCFGGRAGNAVAAQLG